MTGNAIQEFVNDPNAKKGIAIGIAEMCQVQTQSQLEPARDGSFLEDVGKLGYTKFNWVWKGWLLP